MVGAGNEVAAGLVAGSDISLLSLCLPLSSASLPLPPTKKPPLDKGREEKGGGGIPPESCIHPCLHETGRTGAGATP